MSGLALLREKLAHAPFIAILRGITPADAVPVGEALWDAGWRVVEVPLNSPDAFDSIARLRARFGDDLLLGAGTVLHADDVTALARTGAQLMVCPHTDPALIAAAKAAGLIALPGAASPSECLRALDAGADAIKLFPADALGPAMLSALRAVLPGGTAVLPVGGIGENDLATWRRAGASAFGIGSALYRPGDTPERVARSAAAFNAAWAALA